MPAARPVPTPSRIAVLSVVMLLSLGCRKPNPAYLPVAEAIRSGAIRLPGSGRQSLPAEFAGLTARNVVFLDVKTDGRTFILFPTAFGRGLDVEGWLDSSDSLAPSDYTSVNWGAGGVRQHITIAGLDFLTVVSQHGRWYFVARRVD